MLASKMYYSNGGSVRQVPTKLYYGFTKDSSFNTSSSGYQDVTFNHKIAFTTTIKDLLASNDNMVTIDDVRYDTFTEELTDYNAVIHYRLTQEFNLFPNNELLTSSGNPYINVKYTMQFHRYEEGSTHRKYYYNCVVGINTYLKYGNTTLYTLSNAHTYEKIEDFTESSILNKQYGVYTNTGTNYFYNPGELTSLIGKCKSFLCDKMPTYFDVYKSLDWQDDEDLTDEQRELIEEHEGYSNSNLYYINNFWLLSDTNYFIPLERYLPGDDTRYRNATQPKRIRDSTNTINWWTKWLTKIKLDDTTYDDEEEDKSSDTPGDRDTDSDNIPFSELPTFNILGSGLISAYNLTSSQLNTFSSFLWSDSFYDNIIKNMNNPLDAIISLHTLPIDLSTYILGNQTLKIGGIDSGITDVNKIVSNYIDIDLGYVDINEFYGDYNDYKSTISIYLPFIGEYQLDTNLVMGSKLYLMYHVEIMTGTCVAEIRVTRDKFGINFESNCLRFNGNLATHYPLSGIQKADILKTIGDTMGLVGSATSGNIVGALGGASSLARDLYHQDVITQGNLAINTGSMLPRTPYIKYEMLIEDVPKGFSTMKGRVYNAYDTLSSVKGFTVVSEMFCNNFTGITDEEISELKSLLENGVIV